MKKFITTLCLGLALVGALKPQRAEAGLLIVATGGAVAVISTIQHDGQVEGNAAAYIALSGASIGALGAVTSLLLYTANIWDDTQAGQMAGLFALLAVDGQLNQGAIQNSLAGKFPFIDDVTALDGLTSQIQAKYDAVKAEKPDAYVTLSESEIAASTRHLGLSRAEKAALAAELSK